MIQTPFRPAVRLIGALSAIALMTHAGQGAVIVSFVEVGPDVVATATGTLDTTGLAKQSYGASGGGVARGNSAFFGVGIGLGGTVDAFLSVNGPTVIGSGTTTKFPSSSSGSGLLVNSLAHSLYIPKTYVSGAPFSGQSTFSGQTVSSLGLTPGSYVYSWGSGANVDTITLNVGSVPEPAETAVAVGAVCLAGAMIHRRTRSRGAGAR